MISLDITQLKEEKIYLQNEILKYRQDMHSFEIYKLKQKEYEHYLGYLNESIILKTKLQQLERQSSAVLEFKQMILKTEAEIIDKRIREISDLANTYAANFFNEPIAVELVTTRRTQTQSEKVQIQLQVYYKNMKCDISILSGGEQARLNLAFMLAFAHVFHSPILLLDECTSNLDTDLTEIVIEQIGNIGIPKVIMIAHQVVEGNFQQIIKVE